MTLNLTVVSRRCIYQSADYRLTDTATQKYRDFDTQKIVLVNSFMWSATVSFAGVGHTGKIDVRDWIMDRVWSMHHLAPFDDLLEELLKARDWLSGISAPNNRHSFSVGAFVGRQPVFALISNFEQISGPPAKTASQNLSIQIMKPSKPKCFVSGQPVDRTERQWLANLAERNPEPQQMYAALEKVNNGMAKHNPFVSRACCTTHIDFMGNGGGITHNIGERPFMPITILNPGIKPTEDETRQINELLKEKVGDGAQLGGFTTTRVNPFEQHNKGKLGN